MAAASPSSNSWTCGNAEGAVRQKYCHSQAGIFLTTISKLVRSNSNINDLLSAEGRNNISLIKENANLKIKIIKIKDGNSRKLPFYHLRTTETVGNHLSENVATDSLRTKFETKEIAKPIEDTNKKDASAAGSSRFNEIPMGLVLGRTKAKIRTAFRKNPSL